MSAYKAGDVLSEHFRVEEVVKTDVYKVRDIELEKDLELHIFRDHDNSDFLDEINEAIGVSPHTEEEREEREVLGSLSDIEETCREWEHLELHPNIAASWYTDDFDGGLAVFSEFADKGTAGELAVSGELYGGTLKKTKQTIMKIAFEIIEGLNYVHKGDTSGLYTLSPKKNRRPNAGHFAHGNISPSAMLLFSDGEIKLANPVLCAIGEENGLLSRSYKAPELENGGEPSAASDIYSWALSIAALLMGNVDDEVWNILRGGDFEKFDTALKGGKVYISKDFNELLFKCLAADADTRLDCSEIIYRVSDFYEIMFSETPYINVDEMEDLQNSDAEMNNRGVMFAHLGRVDRAARVWEEVLKLNPRNHEAFYNIELYKNEPLDMIATKLLRYGAGNTKYFHKLSEARGGNFCKRSYSINAKPENAVFQDGKLYIKPENGEVFELDLESGKKKYAKAELVNFTPISEYFDEKKQCYIFKETQKDGREIAFCVYGEGGPDNLESKMSELSETVNGKKSVLRCFHPAELGMPVVFLPDGKGIITYSYFNQALELREIPDHVELDYAVCECLPFSIRKEKVIEMHNDFIKLKRMYHEKNTDRVAIFDVIERLNENPMIGCRWREFHCLKSKFVGPDFGFDAELFSALSMEPILENIDPKQTTICFGDSEDLFAVAEPSVGLYVFWSDGDVMRMFDANELIDCAAGDYLSYVGEENQEYDTCEMTRLFVASFSGYIVTAQAEFEIEYTSQEYGDEVRKTFYLSIEYNIRTNKFNTEIISSDEALPEPNNIPDNKRSDGSEFSRFCGSFFGGARNDGLKTLLALLKDYLYLCQFDFKLAEKNDNSEEYVNVDDVVTDGNGFDSVFSETDGFYDDDDGDFDDDDEDDEQPNKINDLSTLSELAVKLNKLRDELSREVIGQDHAVQEFVNGLFMAEMKSSFSDRNKPKATFTFAGPPGVGKTMLAEKAAKALGLPCRRFDMSQYADHSAHQSLIGLASFWRDSTEGTLTKYVREHPNAILIFDEIEKAHLNTLQLFYQILDEGELTDEYMQMGGKVDGNSARAEMIRENNRKNAKVSFKDTIIILTSNVGRSIYEAEDFVNGADVSLPVLLNAFKTEKKQGSDEPFFPSALVSRISVGFPILFNALVPGALLKISEYNFDLVRNAIFSDYGIDVEPNKQLLATLLYSLGGRTDARMLTAKAQSFICNELYKIMCSDPDSLKDVRRLTFSIDTENVSNEVEALYNKNSRILNVLVCANETFRGCEELKKFRVLAAHNIEEALALAKGDVDFALLELAPAENHDDDNSIDEPTSMMSPLSKHWGDTYALFKALRAEQPELPVYILENTADNISAELISNYIRQGVRGSIKYGEADPDAENSNVDLDAEFEELIESVQMQNNITLISNGHRKLEFDTAFSEPSGTPKTINVRLRNFKLVRAPLADDRERLVGDAERPLERFDDVVGAEAAKKALKECVEYLQNPRKYLERGIDRPKGVLLYGPPGTGKTMLAKALAGESNVTFLSVSGSSLIPNKYTGTGAAAVREMFAAARRYAPSIIFIDEVDAVAGKRSDSGEQQSNNESINALLTEMQGFKNNSKRPVLVVAATNLMKSLDPAFVRRFNRKVFVDLPNYDERVKLIKNFMNRLNANRSKENRAEISDSEIEQIAKRMQRLSPGHIKNIMQNAVNDARQNNDTLAQSIISAVETYFFGEKRERDEETLRHTAYHESGHALINYLCGHTPAYLTIESRGSIGGYMEHSEKETEKPHMTLKDLLGMIRCSLGGRAAELIYFGEDGMTVGAVSDLEYATSVALDIITKYGLDEKFGPAVVSENRFISDSMRDRVTARVNEILTQELENAKRDIQSHGEQMEKLVKALMEKERLTEDQIQNILADK